MDNISIPAVTPAEFFDIALDHLAESFRDYDTKESVIRALAEMGLAKFEPDNLNKFVESLKGWVFLPAMIVQKNFQEEFIWLVCGTEAIVIKRPSVPNK